MPKVGAGCTPVHFPVWRVRHLPIQSVFFPAALEQILQCLHPVQVASPTPSPSPAPPSPYYSPTCNLRRIFLLAFLLPPCTSPHSACPHPPCRLTARWWRGRAWPSASAMRAAAAPLRRRCCASTCSTSSTPSRGCRSQGQVRIEDIRSYCYLILTMHTALSGLDYCPRLLFSSSVISGLGLVQQAAMTYHKAQAV